MIAKESFAIRGVQVNKGDSYEFHAYTDGLDEYYTSLIEAVKQVREWFREGYRSLRVDLLVSEDIDEFGWDEVNVLSYGEFPC